MEYEHKLRALGRLLDARVVRDITVTQVADGLLVMALGQVDASEGATWRPISFEVSGSELDELMGVMKVDSSQNGSTRRSGLW